MAVQEHLVGGYRLTPGVAANLRDRERRYAGIYSAVHVDLVSRPRHQVHIHGCVSDGDQVPGADSTLVDAPAANANESRGGRAALADQAWN